MSGRSIAVVTCYRDPDYVRALTLRQALADGPEFDEVIVVKNSSRGTKRYAEVLTQLIRLRGRRRPDAFLVTFRAFEILPVVLLLARGRPVYYDEFINPFEWFVLEHRKFGPRSLPAQILRLVFRWLMARTAGIITDTSSHARFSSELMAVNPARFHPVPVGSDEATFRPVTHHADDGRLRILYYGSMLPLHGLDIVLEAAHAVSEDPRISVVVVGGGVPAATAVEDARGKGARVEHLKWVDYEDLPALFSECQLMLGGPFGLTVQSQFVITGKTFQFLASARAVMVGDNFESGVFKDRVDAFVVPRGDSAALASAWRWAVERLEELELIGRAGRRLYEREYSRERVAAALSLAFEKSALQMKRT